MNGGMILLAVSAVIAAAIAIEAYLRRGKRRPLSRIAEPESHRNPIQLGHEAIDHASFNRAVAANAALAGKTSADGNGHSHTAVHAQPPLPITDDETYTKRWHDAFGRSGSRP